MMASAVSSRASWAMRPSPPIRANFMAFTSLVTFSLYPMPAKKRMSKIFKKPY
jgi:hypothetical protein